MPATSLQQTRLRRGNGDIGDVADKLTETSRVCRGRDGEVGIVEFGLKQGHEAGLVTICYLLKIHVSMLTSVK